MRSTKVIYLLFILLVSCSKNAPEYTFVAKVSEQDSIKVFKDIDSANVSRIRGELQIAKDYIGYALNKSEELEWGKGLAESYTNLAYINLYESDFEAAMENAVEGLRIAELCGDLKNQGFANLLIGFVYFNLGENNQVIPYYYESLKIRKELGNDYDIGFSYSYLGNYFLATQQYDSALINHQKALDYRLKTADIRSVADSYLLIGSTYLKKKKTDDALNYFQQALLKYAEIKDKKRLAETYRNFAEVYLAEGNLKDAENFLLQANQLADETGSVDNKILIADQIAQIKYQNQDFEGAYDYLRYHVDTYKQTSGDAKYRDIVKNILEYKNEKEKKIKELEFQQKEERQKLIVYAILGVVLLLIGFLFFVFNRLKITRKQKEIIAYRKTQVDKAFGQLEVKNKEILDSITYAKRIQSAILPSNELISSTFREVFVLYMPKDIVAGDFYWLEQRDDKVMFAVGDCTGHGVPGAMVSVVCNNSLNRSVHECGLTKPSDILDKTRELVVNEFAKSKERSMMDGMDISLCTFQATTTGDYELQYAGANNPLWIIRKDADELEIHKPDKQPIGKMEHSSPFHNHALKMSAGDTVYVFSDGYADQFGGENGKKFKSTNFKKLLLSIRHKSMDEQHKYLYEFMKKWQGDLEQVDDICVMGVRF